MNISPSHFIETIENALCEAHLYGVRIEQDEHENFTYADLKCGEELKARIELQPHCVVFHKVGVFERWPELKLGMVVSDLDDYKKNVKRTVSRIWCDNDFVMALSFFGM